MCSRTSAKRHGHKQPTGMLEGSLTLAGAIYSASLLAPTSILYKTYKALHKLLLPVISVTSRDIAHAPLLLILHVRALK